MSEWGCGAAPLDDMGSALFLAAGIIRDLNLLQAEAWIYWQAVENSETGNWCAAFGKHLLLVLPAGREQEEGRAVLQSGDLHAANSCAGHVRCKSGQGQGQRRMRVRS